MGQKSVFVSYSHQDDAWCRQMVATLRAVGYDVWHDETGLRGGDAWVASIQREVQAREVFVLVLTPEAWASEWVQEEFQLAKIARRRIITVLLRNTQVDGFILTTQWVRVDGEEPQTAARAIILAIESAPAPGRDAAPQSAETLDELVTLCQSLASENRHTEALSACDRALTLDPDNFDALRVKGSVLARIGQQSRAATTFTQALVHLDLSGATRRADAEVDDLSEMSEYVFKYAEDPAMIVQVYRQVTRPEFMNLWTMRSANLSGRGRLDLWESKQGRLTNMEVRLGADPLYHLPEIVKRLSALGDGEGIVELLAQYDRGGVDRSQMLDILDHGYGSVDVYEALAHVGLTDLVIQLGVQSHREGESVRALIGAGRIDDAMRHVPELTRIHDRVSALSALGAQERYGMVDRLCREWFGFPPPPRWLSNLLWNQPYATYLQGDNRSSFNAALNEWSIALDQLGNHHDAKAIRKFQKQNYLS